MPRPVSVWMRGVGVCVASVAATSCSGAVEVDSPDVSGEGRAACEALVDDLPDELAGAVRREVEPDDGLAAAWGDPPIVLTCGGSMPEGFDEFSACEEVNGVGWFIGDEEVLDLDRESDAPDLELATIGYEQVVRVTVPSDYFPPDGVMVPVGKAVEEHLRLVDPCV